MSAAVPTRPAAEIARAPASSAGRLVRNVLFLFGGQVASWLFALLWLVVVPRRLGPFAIGELVIATSITALIGTFVNQGAGTLLTKEIARDPTIAGRYVGATLLTRLCLVLPAFAVSTVLSLLLGHEPEQMVLIWLATGGMLAASLTGAFQAAFTGVERMEYIAYASLVGNGLASILGIVLVVSGGRIVALMALESTLSVVLLLLNVLWARGLFRLEWAGAARLARTIVRGGLSYWIGGLFYIAYLWIDSVLLSVMAPTHVVGWYGAPTQVFTSILMVCGVLCTAWFPRLAAAFKDGPERLREAGTPAVQTVMVISLPIAVGIAAVAAPFIHLLIGDAFAGAVPVLMILGATLIPTFFNMVAYQVLLASNRQVGWIKVVAVATAFNIILNLILVPRFQQALGNGAVGTALSLLGSEIFESAAALVMLPWLARPVLSSRVLRAAIATLLMAIVVSAVSHLGVIVQIGCGVVTFGAVAFVLRVATREELSLLRVAVLSRRARAMEAPA